MLKYTICFVIKGNDVLMLNRLKKPNMGLWNGVGGKIEFGESPHDSIRREVREETGLNLIDMTYAGNVIWKSSNGDSGMYVYLADLPENGSLITPWKMEEGLLDWKPIDWVIDSDNRGVVSNIKFFLPKLLKGEWNLEHQFTYEDGQIVEYFTEQLLEVTER